MAPKQPYDPNSPKVADSRTPATLSGPVHSASELGTPVAERLVAYLERLARTDSSVRQLRVAYSDRFPDTAPARRPEPIPERSADPQRDRGR